MDFFPMPNKEGFAAAVFNDSAEGARFAENMPDGKAKAELEAITSSEQPNPFAFSVSVRALCHVLGRLDTAQDRTYEQEIMAKEIATFLQPGTK